MSFHHSLQLCAVESEYAGLKSNFSHVEDEIGMYVSVYILYIHKGVFVLIKIHMCLYKNLCWHKYFMKLLNFYIDLKHILVQTWLYIQKQRKMSNSLGEKANNRFSLAFYKLWFWLVKLTFVTVHAVSQLECHFHAYLIVTRWRTSLNWKIIVIHRVVES